MWEVVLSGDDVDLKSLSESFADSDPAILDRDGEYLFRWSVLDRLSDPARVQAAADEQTALLSGIASLTLGATKPIKVTHVISTSDDGSCNIHVSADHVNWTVRTSVPTVQSRRADGTEGINRPAARTRAWRTAANSSSSDNMARVLQLFGGKEHGWVELYRILEIVKASVGCNGTTITDAGWATRGQLERFSRTANSPDPKAAGDAARHGYSEKQPPPRPMALNDARELIRQVVCQWIDAESQRDRG